MRLTSYLNAAAGAFAVMLAASALVHGEEVPAHRPGELSAEEVLDGVYPYPPSPKVVVSENAAAFAAERLGEMPPVGVHPRVLLSPEQLPELRRRLKETEIGRTLYATMQTRLRNAIGKPEAWGTQLYERLAAGDAQGATALLDEHKGFPPDIGHYQPYLYALVMEAFDAMLTEDAARGKRVAAALATYAALVRPAVDHVLTAPLNDDVWRVKVSGPVTGDWKSDQGARTAVGNHLMGYGYDFAYNFMDDAQRATVRGLIAKVTNGRLWMGARLPHHFRNWNWIAIGTGSPLLALSIEGEEGYDPRVYKLGVEIARDYLTYGISEMGSSTEAVGYTQFGLVWLNPFVVAAARRGDNLLTQNHFRAMNDWYLQTMEPFGNKWTSHGDGGDGGPAIWTMAMWKHFFPSDAKIDFLWQQVLQTKEVKSATGTFHLIEPMLFAEDPAKGNDGKAVDYEKGAKLGASATWFDPARTSLIARSGWSPDALTLQFESRTDANGASHQHSDHGNFTLSALGRAWAKDEFRSVESRHHNLVLIDGKGQGYWSPPGTWLGLEDKGSTLIAACDQKPCYDWVWPKEVITEDPASFIRFKYPRWESYVPEAKQFQQNFADLLPGHRDMSPAVVTHWQGFLEHDPRMWDEDSWPVAFPWNPMQRAFRTVVMERGEQPYVLVVDDLQKDNEEHLYEWLLQTGPNTELAALTTNDIILCDATVPRDADGKPRPKKGDRQLLVRVLDLGEPTRARDFSARSSARLECYERKDTLAADAGPAAMSGSRTFGTDKRLVVPSRSVAPNFKILLFPYHAGDPLPKTAWNADKTELTVALGGKTNVLAMQRDDSGRTRVTPKP